MWLFSFLFKGVGYQVHLHHVFFHSQAFTAGKASMQNSDGFLSRHLDIWPLVLPKAETEALLGLGEHENWASKAKELMAVVNSGSLGRAIFGFAVAQVLSLEVQCIVDKHTQNLCKEEVITTATVISHKNSCFAELQALPNIETLPEKRQKEFRYRGFPLHLKVSCLQDEVSWAFSAAIKGAAVDAGVLQPLAAEDPPNQKNNNSVVHVM